MGRKSSAAGGPVHSPIGCHYANERKTRTNNAVVIFSKQRCGYLLR